MDISSVSYTSNTADFGLKNRDTAGERLSSIRDLNQRVVGNKLSSDEVMASDSQSDLGLRDRNTADERVNGIKTMQERVVQNHGAVAKMNTREALANNTVITNIPVRERGSLVNIQA